VTTPEGVLLVDKPAGMTSHDVVDVVRRRLATRKVGHAGTLDPMATGVLVLGVNRATRLLGHLTLTEKAYDATIRLGATTTTDDAEGELVSRTPVVALDEMRVRSALAAFLGEIQQVPTAVSAIKVGGRRAYDRVRAGEDVQLEARPVTIHALDVHQVRPVGELVEVDISVRCSSGTYIRAIARDVGARLGVGGHLTALRRTRVGSFRVEDAVPLDRLGDEEAVRAALLSPAAAVAHLPRAVLDAEAARILGAADAYQAMREPRPHRPERSADEAAAELRAEARAGRLDADAFEAVLGAAGHRVLRRREGPAGLTQREVEVLQLLARGLPNKEIAERLVISPKTVANHVEHIYAKIGASTRARAGLFAMQHGLLPEESFPARAAA